MVGTTIPWQRRVGLLFWPRHVHVVVLLLVHLLLFWTLFAFTPTSHRIALAASSDFILTLLTAIVACTGSSVDSLAYFTGNSFVAVDSYMLACTAYLMHTVFDVLLSQKEKIR